MSLTLRIVKSLLQKDALNPPNADEATIVFWKRVKTIILAADGALSQEFEAILDVRSRLLQVRARGSENPPRTVQPIIAPAIVAEALVNELTSFTLFPRGRLFVKREETTQWPEWIVRDADHASGLLHRLTEGTTFVPRPAAPAPPGYARVLASLLDSVHENLLGIQTYKVVRDLGIDLEPTFETYTWEVLRSRLADLSDDLDLHLRFAQFFDQIRQFADGMMRLRENPLSVPDYSQPSNLGLRKNVVSFLARLQEPAWAAGLEILALHNRGLVVPSYLRGR